MSDNSENILVDGGVIVNDLDDINSSKFDFSSSSLFKKESEPTNIKTKKVVKLPTTKAVKKETDSLKKETKSQVKVVEPKKKETKSVAEKPKPVSVPAKKETKPVAVEVEAEPRIFKGTLILTQRGYVPVESVKESDKLRTLDGRLVSAIKRKRILIGTPQTVPYVVQKDFFGHNVPSQDTLLTAKNGIIVNAGLGFKMYPKEMRGARPDVSYIGKSLEYYHFELPDFAKDSLMCNNMAVEGYIGNYRRPVRIERIAVEKNGSLYRQIVM